MTADDARRVVLDSEVEALQKLIHDLIGAGQEYEVIKKLAGRVRNGPPPAAEVGQGTPLGEYAALRNLLAAFREDVARKLAKVASDAATGFVGTAFGGRATLGESKADEVAFVWNVAREKMEGGVVFGETRLLRSTQGPLTEVERVADRVAYERRKRREQDKQWADLRTWPKHVVRIIVVKP